MAEPKFLSPLAPINRPAQRCPVARKDASQRVLIMRLGSFGDVLMATPLLAGLRAAYPGVHITWVVEHTASQAIDANPFIDEILVWDSGDWDRLRRKKNYLRWLLRTARFTGEARRRKFDTFVTYHAEQWPALAWAVSATRSIGVHQIYDQFDTPHEEHARWYTDWYTRSRGLPQHHTDIYLLALEALGKPEPAAKEMSLGYTAEDAKAAAEFLAGESYDRGGPLVVIAPRTTWETRCWPADRYMTVGDRLIQRGCRVVIIGSATEQEHIERIASGMKRRPVTAAGVFGFREMAALVGQSDLVISGDTGPMHVAAAVGTPYLALFGPTPVLGTAPLSGRGLALSHPVPCGPCVRSVCSNKGDDHILCMRLVTVSEVMEAAERLLAAAALPDVGSPKPMKQSARFLLK